MSTNRDLRSRAVAKKLGVSRAYLAILARGAGIAPRVEIVQGRATHFYAPEQVMLLKSRLTPLPALDRSRAAAVR